MKLSLQLLDADEIRMIQQCLHAAVSGPFFPDEEFHTLFGLTRDEVRRIASGWPSNAANEDAGLAVWNTLNNLRGYPHGHASDLAVMVPGAPGRLDDLWIKLKMLT